MTLILTGNRASGKTYNLLNIASAQNIPVIVASKERKKIIRLNAFFLSVLEMMKIESKEQITIIESMLTILKLRRI